MSKKIVNIVKNDNSDDGDERKISIKWDDETTEKAEPTKSGKKKKVSNKSDEIFNLNEEIIIGLNSKNALKNAGTQKKKKSPTKVNNKVVKKKNVKSSRVKNKLIIFFTILILILLTLALMFLSPVFNIKSIVVKNNNRVSKEEIISLSQIQWGENIFKYIDINIMDNISKHPYIKEVNVTRNYPAQIVIDVKEREPAYTLNLNGSYVYIDMQGYILEIASEPLGIPEIIGFETEVQDIVAGNRLIKSDLVKLEQINSVTFQAEEAGIKEKILAYTIEEDKLTIRLVDDKVAYIRSFSNLNIKILSLKNVLERTEGVPGEIFIDGQGNDNSPVFRETV